MKHEKDCYCHSVEYAYYIIFMKIIILEYRYTSVSTNKHIKWYLQKYISKEQGFFIKRNKMNKNY